MKTNKKKGKKTLIFISIIGVIILLERFFFKSWLTYPISLAIFIFLLFIIVKTRGYFWKDKLGNKLNFKEFMKRFKQGVEGISPLQQSKTNLMGIWITITGILAGIIVNLLIRLKGVWWWLLLILCGSLILTIIQFIGILQKYWRFKEIDKQVEKLNYVS